MVAGTTMAINMDLATRWDPTIKAHRTITAHRTIRVRRTDTDLTIKARRTKVPHHDSFANKVHNAAEKSAALLFQAGFAISLPRG
jgi:hypothetical protein